MPGVVLPLMEQRECTKGRNDPSSLRTGNTLFIAAFDGFISEESKRGEKKKTLILSNLFMSR